MAAGELEYVGGSSGGDVWMGGWTGYGVVGVREMDGWMDGISQSMVMYESVV